jgi:hypothetical protein
VNTVMNFRVALEEGNFSTREVNVSCSTRTLLHGVSCSVGLIRYPVSLFIAKPIVSLDTCS